MDSDTDTDMNTRCSITALQGEGDGDFWYHDNYSDSSKKQQLLVVDRLSGLPDELLIRILSLLPTKVAAVTCLLSKRLRSVFPLITTLDVADTPPFDFSKCASKLQHFPSFANFVDTVLQAYQSHQCITTFRLGVGSDMISKYPFNCSKYCLPDVKPTHLHSWISFPFTRCGLKELDLRIHVRKPAQLPPDIFTCETLEVLKLDVNLPVHHVSSFRLPILKLLYLTVSHIYDDGSFVAKLVSSCPSLEDLTVVAFLRHVQSIVISSPSLRLLTLKFITHDADNTDFFSIDTPNLEYLYFFCNIPLRQSITNMDRLTKADIVLGDIAEPEITCQQILGLIRSLPNVHHLSLLNHCLKDLNVDAVKDQLPLFRNLKYLELGNEGATFWDKVLVEFLKCSPVLETLVFPQGMVGYITTFDKLQSEYELCRTGLPIIPRCCRFHLKRIVIKKCYGIEREIGLIQFLLKHALVLEELVISRFKDHCPRFPIAKKVELQTTLQNLPRASLTCSIQVV